jgi:hypothetical protein
MRIAVSLIVPCVAACSPVAQQTSVSVPLNQTLTAGVGDVILRAEGRESMPNAFGSADLFGRTRPTGVSSVQFAGLRGDKVLLLRSGISIASDATTMNSTPLIVPTSSTSTMSGMVGTSSFEARGTTSGLAYIPARGSTTVSAQQPTVAVEVDWRRTPRVPMSGRTIVIEGADAAALTYRIE